MQRCGDADDRTFSRGAEVIRFQLDGGKTGGIAGEIGDAAVSGQGVRQRNDSTRMQIAIGRHDGLHDRQFATDARRADFRDDDAEMAGEFAGTDAVEFLRRTRGDEIGAHAFARL